MKANNDSDFIKERVMNFLLNKAANIQVVDNNGFLFDKNLNSWKKIGKKLVVGILNFKNIKDLNHKIVSKINLSFLKTIVSPKSNYDNYLKYDICKYFADNWLKKILPAINSYCSKEDNEKISFLDFPPEIVSIIGEYVVWNEIQESESE